MQAPQSWNDRNLLEDEPFRSHFMALSLESTRRNESEKHNIMLAKAVKDAPGGLEAAQAWFKLAFIATDPQDPRPKAKLADSDIRVFVQFYWLLRSDEANALLYLKSERKTRGYGYCPYNTEPKPVTDITSISSKPKCGRAKASKRSLPHTPSLLDAKPEDISTIHPHSNPSNKITQQSHIVHSERSKCEPVEGLQALIKVEENYDSTSPNILDNTSPCGGVALPQYEPAELMLPLGQKRKRVGSQQKLSEKPSSLRQRTEDTGPLFVNDDCALAPPVRAVFEEIEMDTEDNMTTDSVLSEDEDNVEEQEEEEADQYVNEELKEEGIPLILIDKTDDTGTIVELAFPLERDQLRKLPPIWAKSRQEVCETFDWFRSYQGGVYFSHEVVRGYLLSAFASRRDRFEHNGRLIISHGGGKAESSDKAKGHASAQQADDQLAQDKSVRALLRNYRERRPVVLLIDDKYILFPYDLAGQGVTYAVLGYYMIVHAWAEYHPANNERGRVVRYKFAFQWCEGQGAPWWTQTVNDQESHNTPLCFVSPPIQNNLIPAQKGVPPIKIDEFSLSELKHSPSGRKCQPCSNCETKSPNVYQVGWSCLNPICNRFWMTVDGRMLPEDLEYEPEFLKISIPQPLPPGYGNLLPPLPMPENSNGITTDYAFTRGWHCTRCGRLSCRYKWQYWECMNCEAVYAISGRIRTPKEFWSQTVPVTFHDHFIVPSSKIKQLPIVAYSFGTGQRGQTQTFVLPQNRGFIHHIQAGTPAGKIEADNIFREYQEQAASGSLIFRRWPLRAHKCRGTLLSNYFSQNSGEAYQYVGGTANTVPFDQAPGAVVKARKLMEDRISAALGKVAEFNEVLSAAYMERQKMAFHSDDEIGLGPLVAGLSLGSPALMHFRLNPKHDPHQRHKGVAVTFILRHGDILVMDGAGVQEFYEHTVIPTNFRIAATARFINPNRI